MKKEQYITNLKKALQGFEDDLVEEIVADYEERFYVGVEKGKTEDQIIEELGSIDELITELKDLQYSHSDANQNNAEEKKMKQNVSHIGEKQFDESDTNCRKVIVDAGLANVKIHKATDSVVKGCYRYNSYKATLSYSVHMYQEKDIFYVNVNKTKEKKSSFFDSLPAPLIDIEIFIPEGFPEVVVMTSSGNVELQEVHFENLKVNSGSGDFSAKDCNGKQAVIVVKSGDCDIYNTKLEAISINTMSGDLEIDDLQGKTAVLSTISGDIDLAFLHTENLKVTTISGDSDVDDCNGKIFTSLSKSGDVSINANFQEYNIQSKSGDIDLTNFSDANICAESSSGDITIELLQAEQNYEIKMSSVSGECHSSGNDKKETAVNTYEINVRSSSGDIFTKLR